MQILKSLLQKILSKRPNWLRRKQRFSVMYFYYDQLGVAYILAVVNWEGYRYADYPRGYGLTEAQRKRVDTFYKCGYPILYGRDPVQLGPITFNINVNLEQKETQDGAN